MAGIVRDAIAADLGAIVAAHVQADAETYRPIFRERFRERTRLECDRRWRDAFAAGDVLLVAEDQERVVGFAHAHGDWMSALYLLASHYRQGLGLALLSELCRQTAARGLRAIEFQCVADNANAIAFYETMGARRIGDKTEGEGDHRWKDLIFRLDTDRVTASRRP